MLKARTGLCPQCHFHTRLLILALILSTCGSVQAQRFLSDYDSTLFMKDTLRPILRRIENLHFSGYIQPQFQAAGRKGAPSYEGGNFSDSSNNRFQIRRARIRVDYLLPSKDLSHPLALFAFQFDITERGAFARDIFLKLMDPRRQHLSLTMGLFARPFGYEVNLASAVRESPERGRMSQILMPAERDLGAMASYESKVNKGRPMLKFDAGVFNGPGLSGLTDFDRYKDLISRLTLKPYRLGRNLTLSAGLSLLYGGWAQATKYRYETETVSGRTVFIADSSLSNAGARTPRHYYGADAQLACRHAWGKTEIRGEYWRGTQPGTHHSTVNPGSLPAGATYVRHFDGAFFYLLQNIVNEKWELVAKYDWYDPNTRAKGKEIGTANLTEADIRYGTFGIGFTHYFHAQLKAVAYYNFVRNEVTSLTGYDRDDRDNNFTLRMQLRF